MSEPKDKNEKGKAEYLSKASLTNVARNPRGQPMQHLPSRPQKPRQKTRNPFS